MIELKEYEAVAKKLNVNLGVSLSIAGVVLAAIAII